MSWQRIFELARRQKSPLIITDIAGREPLVVLPLEVYERLIDQRRDGPTPLASISVPIRSETPSAGDASSSIGMRERRSEHPLGDLSVNDKISLEEMIEPPRAKSYPEAPQETRVSMPMETLTGEDGAEDLLLEEKFYLEPLDDEGK